MSSREAAKEEARMLGIISSFLRTPCPMGMAFFFAPIIDLKPPEGRISP